MSTLRLALLISFCLFTLLGSTLVEAETNEGEPRRPGVKHGEKFIGYVPAHQKKGPVRRLVVQVVEEPAAESEPAEADETTDSDEPATVTTVSHQESQLAAPPLPPGLEGEVIDMSPDVKGGKSWVDNRSCYWIRAEYLHWWTKGMNAPPLATTSSVADEGVLGQPSTAVLFGGDDLAGSSRSGARFTIGKWLDPAQCNGIEVNYLALGRESDAFAARLNEFNVLARPFINTTGNTEDSRLIALPGTVQGTLNIAAESEFQSWEVLYRHKGCGAMGCHIDWLVGYRYSALDDRLRIDESTASLTGPTAGTTFDLFDQFETQNTFHGAEFGIIGDWQLNNCWSCEAVAKVAIGGATYRGTVSGQTITTDAVGTSTTAQGGLLALGTNIGSYRWDDFAATSEFGVTLRRELACGFSATFGYSFLYWSTVARAGEQIDRTVNPSQIPPGNLVGTARPTFLQQTEAYWAQGLNFGLEYRY